MVCRQCGAQIKMGDVFCMVCGSKVEGGQTPSKSNEIAYMSGVKAIIGAMLAIAGGASIMCGISNLSKATYYKAYHYDDMRAVLGAHSDIGTVDVIIGAIVAVIGIVMLIAVFKKKKK